MLRVMMLLSCTALCLRAALPFCAAAAFDAQDTDSTSAGVDVDGVDADVGFVRTTRGDDADAKEASASSKSGGNARFGRGDIGASFIRLGRGFGGGDEQAELQTSLGNATLSRLARAHDSNFIRFGRTSNFLRLGRDPLPDSNFVRLGRDPMPGSNFVRLGRDPLPNSNFVRFGRDPMPSSSFVRLGRDPLPNSNFVRLGRDPMPNSNFVRLGRDPLPNSNFVRFGRDPMPNSNFVRLGRDPMPNSSFLRLGRSPAPSSSFLRLGRADNFIRFGRSKNTEVFGRGKLTDRNFIRLGRSAGGVPAEPAPLGATRSKRQVDAEQDDQEQEQDVVDDFRLYAPPFAPELSALLPATYVKRTSAFEPTDNYIRFG